MNTRLPCFHDKYMASSTDARVVVSVLESWLRSVDGRSMGDATQPGWTSQLPGRWVSLSAMLALASWAVVVMMLPRGQNNLVKKRKLGETGQIEPLSRRSPGGP